MRVCTREREGMLSIPLFVIIVFGKSITFGVDCSCVSYTLFYVDATEGIIVGLRLLFLTKDLYGNGKT